MSVSSVLLSDEDRALLLTIGSEKEQQVVDHDREINALMKRVRRKHPKKHVPVEFVSREKLTLIL